MPRSLAECGVKEADLPMLAEEASKQWTANFNPRPLSPRDFVSLYRTALEQPRAEAFD
jgi:alcohol dehydrogenase